METATLPFWPLLALLVFGPPIMACIWRFMARGWAVGVGAGRVSEKTKNRERAGFWILLWACYAIEAVMVIIAAARGTL